ncbi:MAG: response regulator [Gammaproteobacteria bacterium]|nr:response regulator [Gammaproteobacteria bacterium]
MNEATKEQKEALLELVDMAYSEIVDIVFELSSENASEAKETCQYHIDNIGLAAGLSNFEVLQASTEQMSDLLAVDTDGLTAERAGELVGWLSDIGLHLESPGNTKIIDLLSKPLTEEMKVTLRSQILDPLIGSDDSQDINLPGEDLIIDELKDLEEFGDFESTPIDEDAIGLSTPDFEHLKATEQSPDNTAVFEDSVDEDNSDFGPSGILAILIEELEDISNGLDELALSICRTENSQKLSESITSYQSLVSRISQVAGELGLNGLVLISDFIERNLLVMATLKQSERSYSIEVLQGWVPTVVQHLQQPKDDARCIAVVDYLEKEDWPAPLLYKEVRDLIEGLTRELEVSGDFEVEARETEASEDDVALELSADASPELIDAFFAESPGHAEKFSILVESIAEGKDIQNNVEAAQRFAHTLKGSGNLVGVRGIANLAHHLEDIFEHIAKQKIAPPSALALTMQEAADTIEVMLEYLQGQVAAPDDALRVLQDVLDWANRIDSGNLQEDESAMILVEDSQQSFGENRRISDNEKAPDIHSRRSSDEVPTSGRMDAVRVPTDVLDNIFRIVGETAITIGQIQEHINRLETSDKLVRKNDVALQQRRYELENLVSIRGMAARHRRAAVVGGDSEFDPLEMDEYDEFYGVTHSYIEGVADSREILRGITGEVSELNALFLLQQRLNKELQQVVMSTRMVPVSNITARLQRAVRQACRSTGKNAELVIIGEDILLDGEVLNTLTDSLMHMLRNAVDHSIESSEIRIEKGKQEIGEITLSFVQEGNNVVISCIDDGRGLDYARIREKAIVQGLIRESEIIDDRTLARMILQSGFSTSDKVTQISGRGVGMDVVNNTIQSLNGSMNIDDAVNGGAHISLRLPITLLTSHCLIVGAGDDAYAIPTSTLSQILSPGTGKIGQVGGNMSFQIGQEVHPVHSLNSLLGLDGDDDAMHKNTVLLFQTAGGMTAITVDRVVSSYDLVVKGMGRYVRNVRGVTGVSTLGDGSVVAVLDLSSLMQTNTSPRSNRDRSENPVPDTNLQKTTLATVLVVDDSLSMRNSLSQLMKDGGFHVVTARDGLEAVDILDKEKPDIVLTDLEMPRMNGLELVSYIRNSAEWSPLPVVMITSRTMMKHRQEAEAVGVNRYITKPYSEDDVLASINDNLT